MAPRSTSHGPADRRLADQLAADIFAGKLPAGTRLREEPIAKAAGVGRYTVRSALAILETEGLVTPVPNASTVVRTLTLDDVRDIFDLRRVLELDAVDRLVDGQGDVGMIRRAASRVAHLEERELREPRAQRRALDADLAFHRAVVDAVGSPRLSRAFATILGEVRLCLTQLATTSEPMPGEHNDLLRAIDERDRRGARRWVNAHLDEAVSDIQRSLMLAGSQSP